MSVREQIESLESVSGTLLNSLNLLPFLRPLYRFGGIGCGPGRTAGRYDRSGLRYESDLPDDEWAEIAPLIPPAKPGGNKRSVNLREVVKRADVHLEHGLPVACDPEGSRAPEHGI